MVSPTFDKERRERNVYFEDQQELPKWQETMSKHSGLQLKQNVFEYINF